MDSITEQLGKSLMQQSGEFDILGALMQQSGEVNIFGALIDESNPLVQVALQAFLDAVKEKLPEDILNGYTHLIDGSSSRS